MQRAATAVEIFLSYAQADEPLRAELEKHLAGLRRERIIETWHDGKIPAGAGRAREIDARLSSSAVILLLVSPDFIASDYCYDVEMKEALRRHETGAARVIPVLLRAVDWQASPFARIQPLPKNGRPICSAADRDDAFADVARGVREVVEAIAFHGRAYEPRHEPDPLPQAGIRRARATRTIHLFVERGLLLECSVDAVVLKYAQADRGANRAVAAALAGAGIAPDVLRPRKGEHHLTPTRGAIAAPLALFVGVQHIRCFGYQDVRMFVRHALGALALSSPETRHVATTIHGRGAGLDEAESIHAMLLGLMEAVATGDIPAELQKLTIVEKDEHAVPRIRDVIDDHWSDEPAARRILAPWAYELSIP